MEADFYHQPKPRHTHTFMGTHTHEHAYINACHKYTDGQKTRFLYSIYPCTAHCSLVQAPGDNKSLQKEA